MAGAGILKHEIINLTFWTSWSRRFYNIRAYDLTKDLNKLDQELDITDEPYDPSEQTVVYDLSDDTPEHEQSPDPLAIPETQTNVEEHVEHEKQRVGASDSAAEDVESRPTEIAGGSRQAVSASPRPSASGSSHQPSLERKVIININFARSIKNLCSFLNILLKRKIQQKSAVVKKKKKESFMEMDADPTKRLIFNSNYEAVLDILGAKGISARMRRLKG